MALAQPASADGPLGACVRSYAQGYGGGTYVYTSTNGAIGVGFETNAVGGGVGTFIVIQPSNCGQIDPPDLDQLGQAPPAFTPIALVLP